jgi:hypothetical protein
VRAELGKLPVETVTVGDPVPVQARVWLDGIPTTDVEVELVTGVQGSDGELKEPVPVPMTQIGQEGDALVYTTNFTPERSGSLAVGVRVRAERPHQIHPIDRGLLVRWA